MSKRKDRQRFAALKGANPHYQGFRGHEAGASRSSSPEALTAITCTVCGRRRNVAQSIARAEGDGYVCLSCRDDSQGETASEDENPQEAAAAP